MRREDQERILSELVTRLGAAEDVPKLRERLEDSLYFERQRLDADRGKSPAYARDVQFWDGIRERLRKRSGEPPAALLRSVLRFYAEEIQGNFDPRVYELVTRFAPSGLGLMLNAVSPLRLVQRLPELPKMEDRIVIQGEVEHLRRLHERGTVMLVPTHVSNLDSPVVGFALFKMGLPPFLYGAGLNLFTNPVMSFFMRNLGAYTVDRKKQDPVYKSVLKEYATLTIEHGYDNLFFPGGTRSRSGAVERKLKRGLLGCGLSAYVNNLRRGAPNPKVFIVPCTLSSQLVLEAETLIDDFLKEVGKSRYIIDDDEFSQPKRVFDFLTRLTELDSKNHVTVSRGLDVFGNPVDDEGRSYGPNGQVIDDRRYLYVEGEPQIVPDRDGEYTTDLAEAIADSFARDNVVDCTHVTARALFRTLRRRNPGVSTLRLIRTGGRDEDLPLVELYTEADNLLREVRAKAERGQLRLARSTVGPADEVVSDGILHFGIYHKKAAATRRGDRVLLPDRTLLLYYQNRLEGYGLEGGDLLADDRRSLREVRP
ncbi:MAG: 1-acyl-sn-glycerol-3-phosphate acyltransferase [Myxococcota bacterium]